MYKFRVTKHHSGVIIDKEIITLRAFVTCRNKKFSFRNDLFFRTVSSSPGIWLKRVRLYISSAVLVFLFGSASYLGRCGTSLYASEWTSLVAGVSSSWRGVHVCPLVPLILTECPGSIMREICELSVWFSTIYENSNHGLNATWSSLVEAMEAASTGSVRLETMDTYKVALLSSLNSMVLDTVTTFCTHNSRPVAFPGLSKDICGELLGNMLKYIFNNFRACQSPENLLVRTTTANSGHDAETGLQRVVIAGASNLKHSVAYFSDPDIKFFDLSSPGWVPTPGNILDLKEKILFHKSQKVSAFVFDFRLSIRILISPF